MALVAIPGLGRVFGGPTRREDISTRDRAERGHQPLPICLQGFQLLELVLKAGVGCLSVCPPIPHLPCHLPWGKEGTLSISMCSPLQ